MGGRLAVRGLLLIPPGWEFASDIPLAAVTFKIKTSFRMRSHQTSLIVKCTALIAVLAWFVASNHCALSALVDGLTKAAAPAAECKHCPAKESGNDKSGGMTGCCKGVKATTSTKGLADFDAAFCGTPIAVLEMPAPAALTGRVAVGIAGAGPPRTVSFAEAVLSHSHQSHAPPVFG